MAKSIQQPIERKLPVDNKHEIVQAEIAHILSANPFIETERDKDLHIWLDQRRKLKQCGLVLEDKGSNLSQSCYDYFDSSVRQKDNLLLTPVKVLYVKTSLPGGAIDIHIDILNALKRPLNRGQLRDLRRRVQGTLKSYQVQLLIVDDAHLLKRKAMDELVKIYEDLNISIVMAGVYDLNNRLSDSKGYEHISNMFLAVHNYRNLRRDEVASVVAAWEEEVLELWDEKPNLANHEEIIEYLHSCSRGLSKPLYKYLHQISIAQLELDPSSEEEIDIYEIIGIQRTARLDSD
ncbi:MAG: ATP-binding protein [Pleurocapsa sp. MO_226.B13]|nr:ATP-binding protein [Pleurocapsa sp. MO_226.B13]